MGDDDSATTAAAGMRLLRQEFTQPRARTADAGPRASRVHAPPPCDLGLLDYLEERRAEVIDATLTATADGPQPPPAPADEGIYQWMVDATAHLDGARRRVQEAIAYHHKIAYAIRAGDNLVIRRLSCPKCRCYSLMWRESIQRAVCIQRACRDKAGRASQWDLKQLAHHHIETRPQRVAT
jgi:hypothetical protein